MIDTSKDSLAKEGSKSDMNIIINNMSPPNLHISYEKIITDCILAVVEYEKCPFNLEISVILWNKYEVHGINLRYRNINKTTDVLSFPMLEFTKPATFTKKNISTNINPETQDIILGDIVINKDSVIEQAEEYGHTRTRELAFLTVHSMLHLLGYDHIEEKDRLIMEEHQRQILESRGYTR